MMNLYEMACQIKAAFVSNGILTWSKLYLWFISITAVKDISVSFCQTFTQILIDHITGSLAMSHG